MRIIFTNRNSRKENIFIRKIILSELNNTDVGNTSVRVFPK